MSEKKAPTHYAPSADIAQKIAVNRTGKLTPKQRTPIMIAGVMSSGGLLCAFTMFLSFFSGGVLSGSFLLGSLTSQILFGLMWLGGMLSFLFLLGVTGVNASMFLPEIISPKPVKWERGILEIKLSERERPEMPFSYIIGSYSFAPFIAPDEVPLEKGREYIVYYSARSRLLLSIAPTDQDESNEWLPVKSN